MSLSKTKKIIVILGGLLLLLFIIWMVFIGLFMAPEGLKTLFENSFKNDKDLQYVVAAQEEIATSLGLPEPVSREEIETEYGIGFYDRKSKRQAAFAAYYYALPHSIMNNIRKLEEDGWQVRKSDSRAPDSPTFANKGCVSASISEPVLESYSSPELKELFAKYSANSTLTQLTLRADASCGQ